MRLLHIVQYIVKGLMRGCALNLMPHIRVTSRLYERRSCIDSVFLLKKNDIKSKKFNLIKHLALIIMKKYEIRKINVVYSE